MAGGLQELKERSESGPHSTWWSFPRRRATFLEVDRRADIVVISRSTGRPQLVVEVKRPGQADAIEGATQQLRDYMHRAGVPLGLLVVGSRMRFLRDSFTGAARDSIELAWEAATDGVPALRPPQDQTPTAGFEYASRVQEWLESLRDPLVLARLPEALRVRMAADVVPVVEVGTVTAAGPRFEPRVRHP
ncbi:MAG TPA: hypothetical protein VHV30_00665 [Polyangiaceae bacterium]|jgi:hypothetical protein|nr:hypothetical protein [Polyangiaceae bacterium]